MPHDQVDPKAADPMMRPHSLTNRSFADPDGAARSLTV
jgi:hypothetical protein